MITKSLTQLLAGVRAATDPDVTTPITDTQITDWLNEDIRELWAILAPFSRDWFTAVSANLTIAAGASTYNLASITDFLALRGVDRDAGTNNWQKLRPWRFPARSRIGSISYRVTQKTLRIEPRELAPGTYRVWYIPVPTDLPVGTPATTIDLPLGGDKYVIQGAAARVRARMEEDPSPHLALQASALNIVKRYMASHGQGEQDAIVDVSADYDEGDGLGWP